MAAGRPHSIRKVWRIKKGWSKGWARSIAPDESSAARARQPRAEVSSDSQHGAWLGEIIPGTHNCASTSGRSLPAQTARPLPPRKESSLQVVAEPRAELFFPPLDCKGQRHIAEISPGHTGYHGGNPGGCPLPPRPQITAGSEP